MCLPEVQKVSQSTGEKRKRGVTGGEGDTQNARLFTRVSSMLYVKYYEFTILFPTPTTTIKREDK